MQHDQWLLKQAESSLIRLLPRLEPLLNDVTEDEKTTFITRLQTHFPRLFGLLFKLYGDQYDFFYHLEQILIQAIEMYQRRSPELKALDQQRESNPTWFQTEKVIGAVCYVDLFAGDLSGLRQRIPYLQELGITFLHLMPLFKTPEEQNDGGYAVSDYRTVAPHLGTMKELADLATELRSVGISLVLDFVFNHTSDEHEWAKRALAGDETYQNYYLMFPDRELPDQYERTLREIFPEQAPGSFTYHEKIDRWVWTSFWDFQWDLNYRNPTVFKEMLGEMLFLANQGVEVLRLDAVAFIWKQMGTSCESLPQAHWIIQAYNALCRIVAPTLLFKSEAIVHPDDVMSYISWEEAPLSYNPTLMALIWESLATRKSELLRHSMARRFELPEDCAWINYVRVHDDIGWTFADEDAGELGINGYDHRQFLNQFYTAGFPGSFAAGLPFNFNPRTGDMRISGTAASLAGLEQAFKRLDPNLKELALRRLLMIHSIIMSVGGIPLIYLGDEIATLNNYSYRDEPVRADDSRWAHRPPFDWERAEAERSDPATPTGRIFQGLRQLIQIRRSHAVFATGTTTFFDVTNPHILAYVHNRHLLCLCNFSEQPQKIPRDVMGVYIDLDQPMRDLLTETEVRFEDVCTLAPYEFRWVVFNE